MPCLRRAKHRLAVLPKAILQYVEILRGVVEQLAWPIAGGLPGSEGRFRANLQLGSTLFGVSRDWSEIQNSRSASGLTVSRRESSHPRNRLPAMFASATSMRSVLNEFRYASSPSPQVLQAFSPERSPSFSAQPALFLCNYHDFVEPDGAPNLRSCFASRRADLAGTSDRGTSEWALSGCMLPTSGSHRPY